MEERDTIGDQETKGKRDTEARPAREATDEQKKARQWVKSTAEMRETWKKNSKGETVA